MLVQRLVHIDESELEWAQASKMLMVMCIKVTDFATMKYQC
jgi:hypothetical protein